MPTYAYNPYRQVILVNGTDKIRLQRSLCSDECVEILLKNPDLLMTKMLWMIEALDVDPYKASYVFNVQTARKFYESLQLETGLELEPTQRILFAGNHLVNWNDQVYELIELWRMKSDTLKKMLKQKGEQELLVYMRNYTSNEDWTISLIEMINQLNNAPQLIEYYNNLLNCMNIDRKHLFIHVSNHIYLNSTLLESKNMTLNEVDRYFHHSWQYISNYEPKLVPTISPFLIINTKKQTTQNEVFAAFFKDKPFLS